MLPDNSFTHASDAYGIKQLVGSSSEHWNT